jgi:hypothetical protein
LRNIKTIQNILINVVKNNNIDKTNIEKNIISNKCNHILYIFIPIACIFPPVIKYIISIINIYFSSFFILPGVNTRKVVSVDDANTLF